MSSSPVTSDRRLLFSDELGKLAANESHAGDKLAAINPAIGEVLIVDGS